jgi:hypothetical protein
MVVVCYENSALAGGRRFGLGRETAFDANPATGVSRSTGDRRGFVVSVAIETGQQTAFQPSTAGAVAASAPAASAQVATGKGAG